MNQAPRSRIAVISDVHGNLEALKAVLADIDASASGKDQGVPRILNLGDMVGYGPEPDACVKLLAARGAESVLGNHEHGLLEAQARSWFNPQARKALDRTRALLSEEALMSFRTLPRTREAEGALFVHGCPPGLVSKYLYELDDEALREAFGLYPHRLCFVGHTHELQRVSLQPGGRIERKALGKGVMELDPAARHIINAGAVGQPRDGGNKAKYLLWEPAAPGAPDRIEVRRVAYDIAKTAAAIIEKGLPAVYADRLW
ncbi:Diadenosine tetraphosphatase ApaH/serine/threonine protein phosphatase, PP2A family [Humidesulfovibrio mexicanus]|uniref:Diadenosine tetraphosphatase ApaH/serine/threonine protein phosphatase, PP2A family n=1 Tax=Humidesulfovibrio mexicanus TaxID=147047 RepID=A0A239CPH2_9BACT|nr:metallophosphoesterase [Humidesulfovibrio mexicanus]SNS21591.1 Diadenosine tetraphosphatase ApaH/serine/threonine protein phosphatase, PP2A family [Humidesulfovibrio mexicanus]